MANPAEERAAKSAQEERKAVEAALAESTKADRENEAKIAEAVAKAAAAAAEAARTAQAEADADEIAQLRAALETAEGRLTNGTTVAPRRVRKPEVKTRAYDKNGRLVEKDDE